MSNVKKIKIEDIYVDQSQVFVKGFKKCPNIFSSYTAYGIKCIDSEYGRRICDTQEDPKTLEKEIRNNPHLHKIIKDNLIQNLWSYVKKGKRGNDIVQKDYTIY